jgi:hypothetical protein
MFLKDFVGWSKMCVLMFWGRRFGDLRWSDYGIEIV